MLSFRWLPPLSPLRKGFFFGLIAIVIGLGCPLRAAPSVGATNPAAPMVDVYLTLEGDPACLAAGGVSTGAKLADASARTKARYGELAAQHAALQPRIEAAGGVVRAHYTRLVNAVKVRVAADKISQLAGLPGVKHVAKVRQFKRALTHSVPFIGAPAAWSLLSPAADGAGVRVGIIDTGIDYTHADFGGPGTTAYYGSIDPTRIAPGVFPTAKVVGGYDLAGDNYNASDPNNSVPVPDSNPLDCEAGGGHGTHVAGIAAGFGVLTNGATYTGPYSSNLVFSQFRVGPGVAPGALLYAIKIFSCVPEGTTELVPDGLEWAADPNGDGDFSDRLDVVNLSLGSTFGDNDPEDPNIVAANNLAQLGCVVVCAAGNDGNIFFAAASPGSASQAIAVANTISPTTGLGLRVVSPAVIAGDYFAVEGAFTTPVAQAGPIQGKLVYVEPSLACDPIQNAAAISNHIALIDRGTCFFTDKIQAAQDAGAIAVVMVDNVVEPPIVMGGTSATVDIPGVMISEADGALIKSNLLKGVIVLLSSAVSVSVTRDDDNLNTSSSRGPVPLAPYLKPEIAAPGTSIYSAAVGTGTSGQTLTGTSMATPHVSGAAAILRQLHPQWKVEDIKSALMNTTVLAHDVHNVQYPESWQGAGRVQVGSAALTEVTVAAVNDNGNVALGFGSLVLSSFFQTNATLALSNHGTNVLTFQLAVSNTIPQAGVTMIPGLASVTVQPGSSTNVPVTFTADPAQFNLQPDTTTAASVDGSPQQLLYEASGQIWFLGAQPIHVPYYANLRAGAAFRAQTNLIVVPPLGATAQTTRVKVLMSGSTVNTNALVSVFELGATIDSSHLLDPFEAYADATAIGAATDIATSGSVTNSTLYFGIATSSDWATPQPALLQMQILIDTNNDGYADFILQNGTLNDVNGDANALDVLTTTVASFDSLGNELSVFMGGYLNYYSAADADTAPYNNNVMVQTVSAGQLGLTEGFSSFRYQLVGSGALTNISSTGWIPFDAARPALDATANSPDGTPFWSDGQAVLVNADLGAAASAGKRIPTLLLLHHHNLAGHRVDLVRVDLSNANSASGFAFRPAALSGGVLTLSWAATTGIVYEVQYKTSLTQTNWSSLTTVTAAGATASATDSVSNTKSRFYRVVALP